MKNFEISTFTRLNNCCTRWSHGNLKNNNVCVPDRDQNSSLLCISSSFLFNIGVVHHFDTVNHLDTVETGHIQTPSTCLRSPASSFQVLRKTGRGPGNKATHALNSVMIQCEWLGTRLPFDRSNAPTQASQLLHEIGHSPYEAGQKLVSK